MSKKLLARVLLLIGALLLVALFAWEAFSEELTIVDVRSNIPLAEKDPVYHDYYINSGASQALKTNLVVNVFRKITIHDSSGAQTYGDMMAPVGQLKLIYVGDKFAVGREYKLLSREDLPMIEQKGIMIGDKIDLKASFVDNQKLPSQKTEAKSGEKTHQEPQKVMIKETVANNRKDDAETADDSEGDK